MQKKGCVRSAAVSGNDLWELRETRCLVMGSLKVSGRLSSRLVTSEMMTSEMVTCQMMTCA